MRVGMRGALTARPSRLHLEPLHPGRCRMIEFRLMTLFSRRPRTGTMGSAARFVGRVVVAALLVLIGSGSAAWALGESITDVKVLGNVRTGEDTIRSLAGVDIGDQMEADTLAS